MKKKKGFCRIISTFLISMMIVGIFGGCNSNTSSGDAQSKPQGTASGSLKIEGGEGVTLTYWIPMESQQAQKFSNLSEHPYWQWLQNETGVKIEFIHPTWEQAPQQLTTMIATGKYYDMLYYPEYPGGPQAGIDEKCFVDLNQYLDKYMPDYKEALNCSDGSFCDWEWGKEKELYKPKPQEAFKDYCLTSSGALWCVSEIWTTDFPAENGPVIRKDWLDEAGLSVPETLDELEVVLDAFKKRGKDIIPMNLGKTGTNNFDGSISTAFDLYGEFFTMDRATRKVLPHAYVQDAFKDYLTLINKWYGKGYIDPDFMNRDGDAVESLFLSDRLGIYFDQTDPKTPDIWKQSYSGDERFDVVAMPIPRKSKDQVLKWSARSDSAPTNYTCISTSCEHPEIAAQLLNVGFKKEGILRANYGVEGTDYKMVDGSPQFLDPFFDRDVDDMRFNYLSPLTTNISSYRAMILSSSKNGINEPTDKAKAAVIWNANSTADIKWEYTVFEGDSYGDMDSKKGDALTYAEPMVLKFIMGQESLDKFDEFRNKTKSLGMDEAQRIAQENVDKMKTSK